MTTADLVVEGASTTQDRQRRIRSWKEKGYVPTSYSALSTFHYCPAQYHFALTDRDQGGDASRSGHVLHSMRELGGEIEAGNDLRIGQDPAFWKMVDALNAYPVTDTMQFERELFWEFPVTVKDGTVYTVQVRAFLDTLDVRDGAAYIDDFKTGRMLDYSSWEQQRALYAVVVAKNLPEVWRGVRARTLPLRFPGKEESKGMWNWWTLEQIEREAVLIEQKATALAQAHHDKKFPPRPESNRCRLCEYAHKCDAAQRRMADFTLELPITHRHIKRKGAKEEVVEVTQGTLKVVSPFHVGSDKAKLRQLGAATFHLEAIVAANKAVLKAAAASDQIDIPEAGGAYAHWEQSSTKVRDIQAAIQRCIELEIPLSEVFSWNSRPGEKYLREYEDLAALAEQVPSRYPRFEFKKFKEDPE